MTDRDEGEVREREEEVPPPTGTLFFMMLFLMLMAGMWVAIYLDFIGR